MRQIEKEKPRIRKLNWPEPNPIVTPTFRKIFLKVIKGSCAIAPSGETIAQYSGSRPSPKKTRGVGDAGTFTHPLRPLGQGFEAPTESKIQWLVFRRGFNPSSVYSLRVSPSPRPRVFFADISRPN